MMNGSKNLVDLKISNKTFTKNTVETKLTNKNWSQN